MAVKKINPSKRFRIDSIHIQNYKKIDDLEIHFPGQQMPDDLDILVFGSKNGGGKTSVLECCSLLILAGAVERFEFRRPWDVGLFREASQLLIKAGKKTSTIRGEFSNGASKCSVLLQITEAGISQPKITGVNFLKSKESKETASAENISELLKSILAFSGEPLIRTPLIYFNGYRKVQESNPELGMMADDYSAVRLMNRGANLRSTQTTVSAFKLEILRSLMGQASLFEGFNKKDYKAVLSQFNSLTTRYCGGTIGSLRALPDNRVDILIQPIGGSAPFSFDGLSSGQKEIISTLFLIWTFSQDKSLIVLIDEPELHLNAEWHSDLIEQLKKIAPNNQYIFATHSEEIFRSVKEPNRAILSPA